MRSDVTRDREASRAAQPVSSVCGRVKAVLCASILTMGLGFGIASPAEAISTQMGQDTPSEAPDTTTDTAEDSAAQSLSEAQSKLEEAGDLFFAGLGQAIEQVIEGITDQEDSAAQAEDGEVSPGGDQTGMAGIFGGKHSASGSSAADSGSDSTDSSAADENPGSTGSSPAAGDEADEGLVWVDGGPIRYQVPSDWFGGVQSLGWPNACGFYLGDSGLLIQLSCDNSDEDLNALAFAMSMEEEIVCNLGDQVDVEQLASNREEVDGSYIDRIALQLTPRLAPEDGVTLVMTLVANRYSTTALCSVFSADDLQAAEIYNSVSMSVQPIDIPQE